MPKEQKEGEKEDVGFWIAFVTAPFFDFIAIVFNVFLPTTANTFASNSELFVPRSS